MDTSERYWAAETDPSEYGAELMKRIGRDVEFGKSTGLHMMRRRAFRAYFGLDESGGYHKSSAVTFAGDQGELATLKVNATRNLVQHMLTYMTHERLAWQPRATSNGAQALAEAKLASAVLDHYRKRLRAEQELTRAKEMSLVLDEGYVLSYWDVTKGKPYAAPAEGLGAPVREGDLTIESINPLDVVKDPRRKPSEQDWHIIRRHCNRWDLVARYPEHRDRILSANRQTDLTVERAAMAGIMRIEADDIPVYELWHRKTDALPDGRFTRFVTDDCILLDQPLPYDNVTLRRVSVADLWGTAYGYAPAYDQLALQSGLDALYSIVMTNQSAFGVQNVAVESDSNVDIAQVRGGMNLWKIPRGAQMPQAVNLTQTPKEIFTFIDVVQKAMETLMGVNSVVRGAPDAQLKSGAALAFMESRAMQFMSQAQRQAAFLDEDVATDWLDILRAYCKSERLIEISGKDGAYQVEAFTGDKIGSVSHVVVDIGNPLMQTVSGRIEVAEKILSIPGANVQPQEYLQIIETGTYKPLIQSTLTHLDLIRRENEALAMGPSATQDMQMQSTVQSVPVMPTDKHDLHVQEHTSVLDAPEARANPNVVNAVLAHISEHNKYIAQAQMSSAAAGPPPSDEGAPGQPPPKSEPETAAIAPSEPQQPNMPVNPLTGQRAERPEGGMS